MTSKSLDFFARIYYPDIALLIEEQQKNYGLARIHSHRHISRCIIYCDWFCNYFELNNDIDRYRLFFYVAFHDIGRKGELEDVWESESYDIYIKYITNNLGKTEFLIDQSNFYDLLKEIAHDVDCLDIMRLGTGRGGIMGFDTKYLSLFKEQNHIQEQFKNHAWNLISLTDSIDFDVVDCLYTLCKQNEEIWKIGI